VDIVSAQGRRFLSASLDIARERDRNFFRSLDVVVKQGRGFLGAILHTLRARRRRFLGASLNIARAQEHYFLPSWVLCVHRDNFFWSVPKYCACTRTRFSGCHWILGVQKNAVFVWSLDISRAQVYRLLLLRVYCECTGTPILGASLDIVRAQVLPLLGSSLDIERPKGRRFWVPSWRVRV
jgi:hypothetical protein